MSRKFKKLGPIKYDSVIQETKSQSSYSNMEGINREGEEERGRERQRQRQTER